MAWDVVDLETVQLLRVGEGFLGNSTCVSAVPLTQTDDRTFVVLLQC